MHSDVQRLFLELADLSVAERVVYFDRHPVDPRVRTEVESLLRYDSGEKGDSITGVIHAVQERFAGSLVEQFCGPYKLIRLLGQGGMGSVYLLNERAVRSASFPDPPRFERK